MELEEKRDWMERKLNNSFSFLVSRHPLERLLSAYRFTFEHGTSLKNRNNLNRRIIQKYQNMPTGKVSDAESNNNAIRWAHVTP